MEERAGEQQRVLGVQQEEDEYSETILSNLSETDLKARLSECESRVAEIIELKTVLSESLKVSRSDLETLAYKIKKTKKTLHESKRAEDTPMHKRLKAFDERMAALEATLKTHTSSLRVLIESSGKRKESADKQKQKMSTEMAMLRAEIQEHESIMEALEKVASETDVMVELTEQKQALEEAIATKRAESRMSRIGALGLKDDLARKLVLEVIRKRSSIQENNG